MSVKLVVVVWLRLLSRGLHAEGRDEDKIAKACYWPHEVFEPCFGGCAEVSCDNPRHHLRPCYPYCEPGCVCAEPRVRDDRTHQCVLPQDCTPTQMGIPVPPKRSGGTGGVKYPPRTSRSSAARAAAAAAAGPAAAPAPPPPAPDADSDGYISLRAEEGKPNEVSRMGNYFNIVIAPPPIKTFHPRKLTQIGAPPVFRRASKRKGI